MKKAVNEYNSERGGAGVKFLIIVLVLGAAINAGINYIPVAYSAQTFKQEMDTSVVQAMAVPPQVKPVDMVKNRIAKAAQTENLPPETFIDVRQTGNVVQARAVYTQKVSILPFGIYDYAYHFDHTATPQGFLVNSSNK